MRIAAIIVAIALAACTPAAEAPTTEAPAPAADPAAFAGDFTAMSTTAMSLTGDLNAAPDVLSFARGFRIEGGPIEAALSGDTDLSAGGGTVNDVSALEVSAIELRRIANVRVAADAPAPDLCGGAQATYAILGRSDDVLTLHIFSGADAPGPNAHDTQLCGVFNYFVATAEEPSP